MYIKGIYKKTIYNRESYTVGLIKVRDNDIDPGLNDKTITFTGYFSDINLEDNLLLNGEFTVHKRYGEQFTSTSYEVVLPEEKDGIITLLSSDMFKGIGEGKALKIYETFKDKTIETIMNNPDKLSIIKGITKKNIQTLHDGLIKREESIETIIELNDYGFNNRESTILYNRFKNKTIDIIQNNVYDVIDESFTFKKIDILALRHQYKKLDKRRIKAAILYVFDEIIRIIGDTYLVYEDIYDYLKRVLLLIIDYDLFNDCLDELKSENKIILENNKYYLTKMYYAEKNIAKRFVYLNNQKECKIKNLEKVFLEIQKNSHLIYNDRQKEAILNAFKNHFMIITGGPGTGKTTIIKQIVYLYQTIYKKSYQDTVNDITLLAPTGRAAKRMMEAINHPASTIHSFLKWNKENNTFGINEYNKVDTKIVIIDEASMIDTYLLDSLLKGLYYDTKIILVGDYNQLPSVASGEILKDLIESKKFNVIELTELYRQKENSNIITLAYDINDGVYNKNIFNVSNDLTFIKADSDSLISKFSEICYTYKNIEYSDYIILAPMYKTINGIDNLNLIAREIFNPKSSDKNEILISDVRYREGDKVILLVNMPDDNVFNGDIGIIVSIDSDKKEVYIDFDGNIVKYNPSTFANFKLGYVTSIHKSQGSEFKVVIIIILNEYSRMLYRKLLYTGCTRAKENLYLIGEESAIKKAINNNISNDRKTTLCEMILKMYEEIKIE